MRTSSRVGGSAATSRSARIAPALLAGALTATIPLVLLALHTTTASAVILLAIVGLGRCVFDVSGRTLLQRTAAPAALAGVFALLESMLNVGLAAGSLLVPLLIALGGADAALVGVAATLLLLLALAVPRLVRLDEAAHVPLVQMHVLRAITIFRALPGPTLETLARSVEHAPVDAGTTLMRQGDPGQRYFAIASGDLSIQVDGAEIAVRSRGEGVGEIALLRDMPRTATVIARTDAELYSLEREPFLLAVTGHAPALLSADSMIDERLANLPD